MKRLIALLITLAALATACQGNVFDLTTGDCFNDPDGFEQVSDVEIVDCGEPHDNEVYAIYDMSDLTYPGPDRTQQDAADECIARFEPYVERDYLSSTLDISALTPTSQSWDQDDREVVCFLFTVDRTKLTTSARGTGI